VEVGLLLDGPASPGRPPTSPGEALSFEQLRADRAVVERAAAHLRHVAIRAGYAGLDHKHVAFALALMIDG
jgi:hypothetical protein